MGLPVPDSDMPANIVPADDLPDIPEAASPAETAGRVSGLAARGVATGTAGMFGQVAQAVNPIGRAEAALVPDQQTPGQPYTPKLSDMVHPQHYEDFINWIGDKFGAPKPEGAGERIGYAAAHALPSAVVTPEAPIAGAVSAAAGGAASQGAKEAGLGPAGQAIAGVAGGALTGSVAGLVKGAGTGISPEAQTLMDAGVPVNVAQA